MDVNAIVHVIQWLDVSGSAAWECAQRMEVGKGRKIIILVRRRCLGNKWETDKEREVKVLLFKAKASARLKRLVRPKIKIESSITYSQ